MSALLSHCFTTIGSDSLCVSAFAPLGKWAGSGREEEAIPVSYGAM